MIYDTQRLSYKGTYNFFQYDSTPENTNRASRGGVVGQIGTAMDVGALVVKFSQEPPWDDVRAYVRVAGQEWVHMLLSDMPRRECRAMYHFSCHIPASYNFVVGLELLRDIPLTTVQVMLLEPGEGIPR